MKLLALETSATVASCAITEDGRVLARAASHARLTHSQTLLPMVEATLRSAAVTVGELDGMAVAAGPGSFTGVRIGVAALKGLAHPAQTPCVGVSTLAAMARPLGGLPLTATVCAAMDARCGQIYTARFALHDGTLTRLTPDEAVAAETVCEALTGAEGPILLVGDGAALCYDAWRERLPALRLTPETLRYQDAVGVALEAEAAFAAGQAVSPGQLMPLYLRLPQAERELRSRPSFLRTSGNPKQK